MDSRPPLLYLTHRIPYPPNKGDKLTTFHIMRYLSRFWRIHLGTFIDMPEDWAYVEKLKEWCESSFILPLHPKRDQMLALRGMLTGEALTVPYYRRRAMQRWVNETLATQGIRHAVVYCSSVAQYLDGRSDIRRVVDFADVDSAKWISYAEQRSGIMAWMYRREGRLLAEFERHMGGQLEANVLCTEAEAALFNQVVPGVADRTHVIWNGVDTDFFCPDPARVSPFAAGEKAVVFTGVMDYWPNVDAVCHFAEAIWPALRARHPDAVFYVVGMNPSPVVRALAQQPGIVVTGKVPETLPYLQHAAAVVAPLRIARGIQNKVLEAMAMARPVVISRICAQGLTADPGRELLPAGEDAEYVEVIDRCLREPAFGDAVGQAARARVLSAYSWDAHLEKYNVLLGRPGGRT